MPSGDVTLQSKLSKSRLLFLGGECTVQGEFVVDSLTATLDAILGNALAEDALANSASKCNWGVAVSVGNQFDTLFRGAWPTVRS